MAKEPTPRGPCLRGRLSESSQAGFGTHPVLFPAPAQPLRPRSVSPVRIQKAYANDPVVTSPQPQLVRKLPGLCSACRLPDFGVEITGPSTIAIVFSIMPLAPTTPPTAPAPAPCITAGGRQVPQSCSVLATCRLPLPSEPCFEFPLRDGVTLPSG